MSTFVFHKTYRSETWWWGTLDRNFSLNHPFNSHLKKRYTSGEQHRADKECCVVVLSGFEICSLCMWAQKPVSVEPHTAAECSLSSSSLCGNKVSHQYVMDHLQTSSDWEGEGRLVLARASGWLGLSIALPQGASSGLNALLICLANIFFLFPQQRVHILSVFDVSRRRVYMKGLKFSFSSAK